MKQQKVIEDESDGEPNARFQAVDDDFEVDVEDDELVDDDRVYRQVILTLILTDKRLLMILVK